MIFLQAYKIKLNVWGKNNQIDRVLQMSWKLRVESSRLQQEEGVSIQAKSQFNKGGGKIRPAKTNFLAF